jgi:hypothetical protein
MHSSAANSTFEFVDIDFTVPDVIFTPYSIQSFKSGCVGIDVGSNVGEIVGWDVGEVVGWNVGAVGEFVGCDVGEFVGVLVGQIVG